MKIFLKYLLGKIEVLTVRMGLSCTYYIGIQKFKILYFSSKAVQKSEKSDNMEDRIKLVHNYFTVHLRRELEIILEDRHLLIGYFIIAVEMSSEEVRICSLAIGKWRLQ